MDVGAVHIGGVIMTVVCLWYLVSSLRKNCCLILLTHAFNLAGDDLILQFLSLFPIHSIS